MTYKSSPRPVFSEPTHIPYASVTRYLWGDDEAGRVNDWIYASSSEIHQLVFGFPAGKGFTHSESFRTIFGADEVLIVLQGSMIIANPESGEVQIAHQDDAIFFRKDTWHNAWAMHGEELRVLEYFAPPPSTGTSGKYAQSKPYVNNPKFTREHLYGNWPMGRAEAEKKGHFTLLGPKDRLWSLADGSPGCVTGVMASTEHLTAGDMKVAPGARSSVLRHGGDACFYVSSGRMNIHLPDSDRAQSWFELSPGDGFFVPKGFTYQIYNMSSDTAECYFGVAPHFYPQT